MNRLVRMILLNLHKLPGAYGKLCRYAKHPERYTEEEMWNHIRYTLSLAVQSGNVDLQVFGTENIPSQGGFMLYGNHQGLFDVMAIGSTCEMPLAIVYKKELRQVPFLKQIYACTKSFAMDREDVRQSLTVIQNVTAEVLKGRNYVIFPEGTRSRRGNEMNEFHPGSFRAAVKAKCPIVPMALIDCYKPLDEKGSARMTAQLHYLTPICYDEYKDLKTPELAQLVKSRIAATIEANT